MLPIVLPRGTDTRVAQLSTETLVLLAPPGVTASVGMFRLHRPRGCVLLHEPGDSWPSDAAALLASVTLAAGDPVALAFHRLEDALACHRRLTSAHAEVWPAGAA